MKINRSKFIQHLGRLACAGQVAEVAFNGGFAATALTNDHLLLIQAPGLDGAEPLTGEIGVADVGLLMKACKLLPGEGNTGIEVDVYVESNRLVIDDGSRGVQRLLLAAPKTIGTRIEPETATKLRDKAPTKGGIPLSRAVLDGVCAAFSLYKAEEVEVVIGKEGAKICVGTEKTHRAEFVLEGAKSSKEEYTLLFGRHLIDVFSIVTDFSTAALRVGGEKMPILIVDGEYQYMLSPRSRSADEAKPAVREDAKPAKGEKATGTPKQRAKARANNTPA